MWNSEVARRAQGVRDSEGGTGRADEGDEEPRWGSNSNPNREKAEWSFSLVR